MLTPILHIKDLNKTYTSGTKALEDVSMDVRKGELFALLGPNGAGKTTLIGIVNGLVNKTRGEVLVMGKDVVRDYRFTRSKIGLVPQELTLNIFDTVYDTLRFQRGFYGKPRNEKLLRETLESLSLWDKRNTEVKELSGGMKRRVLIGKALMNEPEILFLDEPTAGVDVELRKGMWQQIKKLKNQGTTIILTTHYLEEAEQMADRIGIINKGKLGIVEETNSLMQRLGNKKLIILLKERISAIPYSLNRYDLTLSDDNSKIVYQYQSNDAHVAEFFSDLQHANIRIEDIETKSSSLEEIFIDLIEKDNHKS